MANGFSRATTTLEPELQAKNIGLVEGMMEEKLGSYQRGPDGELIKVGPADPDVLPAYEIAPRDYFQNVADLQLGEEFRRGRGIGGYKDYMDVGFDTASQARGLYDQGIGVLKQTDRRYDPSDVSRYMDPYQQQVIDATMKELNRQGGIARNRASDQAIRSGAFGGGREGVQRAQLDRNLADVQSRALADLYSRGYSQALDASRSDFANQMARQANVATGLGQFGQGFQGLGESIQNTGKLAQGQSLADYQALYGAGGARQDQKQREMEASRLTDYMGMMYPYQQFGFFQDALNKVPMGQSTFTASSQGGYNPLIQTAATGANVATNVLALKAAFPNMQVPFFGSGG